jgi:GDPmannose 4,6-dehydratase
MFGQSISLRNIIEYIFKKLNIDSAFCEVSNELYRPVDIEDIFGDPGKAKRKLGWKYSMTSENLLDKLLEEELAS